MKNNFFRWQCLIRQYSVRQGGGRPSSGIQPKAQIDNSGNWIEPITVLISKKQGSNITAQFRFIAKKNQDPKERMDAALKHLAEAHYQRPEDFNDELTALFSLDSPQVKKLLAAETVTLKFFQSGHEYTLPCSTRLLKDDDPAFQFTYWHNYMFNPSLPGSVRIVGFLPDWEHALFRKLNTSE